MTLAETPPLSRPWPRRAALVAPLVVAAGALTLLPGAAPPASAAGLVAWSDCDELVGHYRTAATNQAGHRLAGVEDVAAVSAPLAAGGFVAQQEAADSAAGAGAATGPGATGTNVQEQGVDEPDLAKTANGLVLVATGQALQVLQDGRSPRLLATVPLNVHVGGPTELLVDGDRVLVLSSGWRPAENPEPLPDPVPPEPDPAPPAPAPVEPLPVEPLPVEPTIEPLPVDPTVDPLPVEPDTTVVSPMAVPSMAVDMIAPGGEPIVQLTLVDLSDPAAPDVVEKLELDGNYLSARLANGVVRLVTSSYPHVPMPAATEPWTEESMQRQAAEHQRQLQSMTVEQALPQYVRTAPNGAELDSGLAVECTSVAHAADDQTSPGTLLVTTLDPDQGLTPLDSTGVTTAGDLVYASPERLYVATGQMGFAMPVDAGRLIAPGQPPVQPGTQIHSFDISDPTTTRYVASGSVPGWVYGRWAFSEHNGYLRVATTHDAAGLQSSMIVLAEQGDDLVEIGRLDGLGPTERIYAVRYFDDLATVVTFRQTDPLYVLDLSNPRAPALRGELKIPGFSTYLHPIGDGHLLGVGQEADEQGRVTGMQLSVFDLTDLANPQQVHRLQLGPGWSQALHESRAFNYDPQRRLAVLPFSEMSAPEAVGIRVTEDFRLEPVGTLSAGDAPVERVLLGNDAVYAVTLTGVVAGDPATFARTGSATFG